MNKGWIVIFPALAVILQLLDVFKIFSALPLVVLLLWIYILLNQVIK